MGMILRIASSRIVGQGDIVGRSGYFSLNLSANSVMRGRLDARRTLKSLVADLRFVYWLGSAEEKQKAIAEAKIAGKTLVDISLRGGEPLIPIEDWLSYIKYTDRVVTDSFHGCVFSILFQKQFTIYTNKSGGNGRLRSLFSMLGIDPTADNIDYGVVCKRLDEQRTKSYSFLKQALQ